MSVAKLGTHRYREHQSSLKLKVQIPSGQDNLVASVPVPVDIQNHYDDSLIMKVSAVVHEDTYSDCFAISAPIALYLLQIKSCNAEY